MKNLINLQHLYLDGCEDLRYMPGGMGQLKGLKTLSLVVVDKKNRDCQLDEFKELEIRGSLKIKNLERVSDASIARGVAMAKVSSINKLELEWEDNYQTRTRHDKIGEALEVSSTCLKILRIEGYKGVNIPKLVGMSSATLTVLHLSGLNNVEHIFSMNNTSTSVSSHEMNEMVVMLFPLLEELVIKNMDNLRELMSPPIPITRAFPNLRQIEISRCPKLGALTPHLKSLTHVSLLGECSDELLNNISNLSALTNLYLEKLGERSVLFKFGGGNIYYKADGNENENEITSSSLNDDTLAADNNINEAQGGPASSTFQSLRSLKIYRCDKLSCLFDEEGCEKLARGGGGCLKNLNFLAIWNCPELMISLEQWRNLGTHSLQSLYIWKCPKLLVPSKVEEADEVLELLRSLRERLGPNNFAVDILNTKDQSV